MKAEDRVIRIGNRFIVYGNNRKVIGNYNNFTQAIAAAHNSVDVEQKQLQDKLKSPVCPPPSRKKKKNS